MCQPCLRTCVHHVSGPYRRTQKEPKGPRPIVRPSLRSGSLAPALLRGHAATGHPWPIAALPASMPGDPLHRTSSRPPGRAGRSKRLRPEAADRPAWLVYVCTAQSVAADEPCEAASGCVAVVKPDTAVVQVNPGLRFYGRFATDRSLRSSSAATGVCLISLV